MSKAKYKIAQTTESKNMYMERLCDEHDYRYLGDGSFSEVMLCPDKKSVIKIGDVGVNEAYLSYLIECLTTLKDNPYVPKIYGLYFYYSNTESHEKITEETLKSYLVSECGKNLAKKLGIGGTNPKKLDYYTSEMFFVIHMEMLAHRGGIHDLVDDIGSYISIVGKKSKKSNSLFTLKPVDMNLDKVLQRISKIAGSARCGVDIHDENVMFRKKQLVITDPLA